LEKLCDSICLINKGNAVLQGDLKTIKSGYARATCRLNMKATAISWRKTRLVSAYNNYGNYVEIKLAPGAGLTATLAHGGRTFSREPVRADGAVTGRKFLSIRWANPMHTF